MAKRRITNLNRIDLDKIDLDSYSTEQLAEWIIQLQRLMGPAVKDEHNYLADLLGRQRNQLMAMLRTLWEKKKQYRIESTKQRREKRQREIQKVMEPLGRPPRICPHCREPDSIINNRCIKCDKEL